MFQILVVEDDNDLRRLFCTVLGKNGFMTVEADNGESALNILDKEYIDLMICDVMMPGMDGYELTKIVREGGYSMPVLMITVRDSYEDKEIGFQAGVDDYMVKPINVKEMVLRVNVLLKRAKVIHEKKIIVGNTTLEYDALMVKFSGNTVVLPQKEFYLLYKLLSYPNRIFTKYQLMDEIWGMDTESDPHTLEVHIGRLRERFKDNEDFKLVTVRGLGYKAVKMDEVD
jgi:two-component system OmpR family response regulator